MWRNWIPDTLAGTNAPWGNIVQFRQMINTHVPRDPAIILTGMHQRQVKVLSLQKIYIHIKI